jgi:hypothetical protein
MKFREGCHTNKAVVVVEHTSTATNTENIKSAQDNVHFLCQCCAKVKNELQKVKTYLKTLVETVKILKEDQDQLSVRLNNIEHVAVKEVSIGLHRVIFSNLWII